MAAIDIIHQLEHLPGIDVEGNHTISFRGIKANDSGGHASSPLISANIMLMDTASAFEAQEEASSGTSTTMLALGLLGFFALFFVVLMVTGAISDKEEGTLAGIDFTTLKEDSQSATSQSLEAELVSKEE